MSFCLYGWGNKADDIDYTYPSLYALVASDVMQMCLKLFLLTLRTKNRKWFSLLMKEFASD